MQKKLIEQESCEHVRSCDVENVMPHDIMDGI